MRRIVFLGAGPGLFGAAMGILGGAVLAPPPAAADDSTLPIQPVRIEKIASARLGETREIWISLPDRYAETSGRYPVLYMMDGEFNFNSGAIGGLRQAARMGEMPDFIVVGIRNTDRMKDVFPEKMTFSDGSEGGGRADLYLDFIRDELVPSIDKNFRTEGFRALYGTSNSGFTAVYGLLRSPELADVYIAASATLAVRSFIPERDNLIRDFKGGRRRLALVMGENDFPTVLSGNGELKEKIDTLAPPGLSCRLAVIDRGGHVPEDSLLEGLRRLFDGWRIVGSLNESTFAEMRAWADRRLEMYGVQGPLPEEGLSDLGKSLLAGKKPAKALEVLRYLVDSYPRSASAWTTLGDAYRESGQPDKARECYERALKLVPGHAVAAGALKELERR